MARVPSPSLATPAHQLRVWLQDALDAEAINPWAACLSTVHAATGRPSSRMVLIRKLDDAECRLFFFTNTMSRKGNDIDSNPYVALNFYWRGLQRQLRVEGKAELVSSAVADEYWASRPRGHRISAVSSPQSRVMTHATDFEERVKASEEEYAGVELVPRPPHWSGYCVTSDVVEFWQEGKDRQHERLRFRRDATDDIGKSSWVSELLFP